MNDESQVQRILNAGEQWAVEGNATAAIESFDEVLKIDPRHIRALERKSEELLKSGDAEGALTVLDELITLSSQPIHLAARANSLANLRRFSDALVDINEALELEGPIADLLALKGYYLRRAGLTSDALEVLIEAVRNAPTNSQLWTEMGDAYVDLREIESAIDSFREAARCHPPEFTGVDWNIRGDRLLGAGRTDDAIAVYRAGLAVTETADGWCGIAEACWTQKKAQEMLDAAIRACDIDPTESRQWNLKGMALYFLNQFLEALKCFEECIRRDPSGELGFYNKAAVLGSMERTEEAVTFALQAAEIAPDDPDVWHSLSESYLRLGRTEDAIRSADRCLDLEPRAVFALDSKARALLKNGEFQSALDLVDAALAIDSSKHTVWWSKAEILYGMGRLADAEEVLDLAQQSLDPDDAVLQFRGNFLSDKLGRHEEAFQIFEELSLRTDDNGVASDYAEILLKVGRYLDAHRLALHVISTETRPGRLCAMHFVAWACLAVTNEPASDAAFVEFLNCYLKVFVPTGMAAVNWDFCGLRAVVQTDWASSEVKFALLTLLDLQEGRVNRSDLSYFDHIIDLVTPVS